MTKKNKATTSSVEDGHSSNDLESVLSESNDTDSLPSIDQLNTKTPVHLNQQANFYQQIPDNAWDKLSSEQMFDLAKQVMTTADTIDERRFKYAIDQSQKQNMRDNVSQWIGGGIAGLGLVVALILTMYGHKAIALTLVSSLTTIIGVLVGKRLL